MRAALGGDIWSSLWLQLQRSQPAGCVKRATKYQYEILNIQSSSTTSQTHQRYIKHASNLKIRVFKSCDTCDSHDIIT